MPAAGPIVRRPSRAGARPREARCEVDRRRGCRHGCRDTAFELGPNAREPLLRALGRRPLRSGVRDRRLRRQRADARRRDRLLPQADGLRTYMLYDQDGRLLSVADPVASVGEAAGGTAATAGQETRGSAGLLDFVPQLAPAGKAIEG